jgi:hypothetical protein
VTAALGFGLIELLERGEPITKDNLEKAAKGNKERAKKVAKKAVEDNEPSIEILQNIAFTQNKDLTTDNIEFNFNIEELSSPILLLKHIPTSKEKTFPLNTGQRNIVIDLTDWEKGQYEAKLTAKNIPDVMRYFVKE